MSFPDGPIWLVGCGNMAGAMLRRWLSEGLDPAQVTVITRSGTRAPKGVRSLTALPIDEAPANCTPTVKNCWPSGVSVESGA